MKKGFYLFIGYILVPILLGVPFLFVSPITENYSTYSLIMPSSYLIILLGIALFFLYLFYMLGKRYHLSYWNTTCLVYFILFLCTIFIPYIEKTWLSGFHVFLAYLLFIVVNVMMYRILQFHQNLYQIYVCMTILCFFITLLYNSVNGLAEWIYASCISIILTYLYKMGKN